MAEYKTLVKKIPISPDKKTKQKDYLKKGQLPIVDQGQSLVGGYTDDVSMSVNCDLPVIVFGDHTRAVKYITFPFGAGADGIKVLKPNENILPLFLYYGTQYIVAKMPDRGYARHYQYVEKEELAVPPLQEQERIVSRIEELFSQLDAGVETLKKTKAQLAIYRQAVLKEAFEGRLTAEWREGHPDCSPLRDYETIVINAPIYKDTSGDENEIHLTLPDKWIKLRMGDVFQVEVGATPSRRVPEYWNGSISWVSSGEVRFNHIYSTDERITELGLANASTNVQPIGTIMLAMIGEGKTRGQAAILEIPAAHNQNTAAILVSSTPCDPKYIYYFLQMNYENTRRVGSGNNQKALNKERVRALRFPFTSFEEQHMIVEAIESRLSVCDSIEQTIDAILQQAEAMWQSILKDAFEGRLTDEQTNKS